MNKLVSASGALIGEAEKKLMHEVVERGWFTASYVNEAFEATLASYIGVPHILTCNSGSSANLIAIAALAATGRIKSGQEVRVPAMSFPTTVNPLFLYGAVPVLVDVDPETMCPTEPCDVAAHPLGNPVEPAPPLLEDCCDALGSLTPRGYHVGKTGLTGTVSFFPAHHITTGEGGAVWTSDPELATIMASIRDWGRDCWCDSGQNNTCGKRFDWHFPPLPPRYDHKYTITQLGFNLKMTELQAACGLAQIRRLPDFVEKRRRNFDYLRKLLAPLEEFLILPRATPGARPSWFGLPLTIREEGQRAALQSYLVEHGIDSRLLFAGNLAKQPYMQGRTWRQSGELKGADKVMNDSLWLGVWPGLAFSDLEYVAEHVGRFFGRFD